MQNNRNKVKFELITDFELTHDTSHVVHAGELCGVYYEYVGEN